MKKILPLLLALLLLAAPVAYAETADAVTLSDINLYYRDGEEETSLELTGLKIVFAAPEENLFVMNVLGDDNLLLNAAFKMEGSKMLWTIDGLGTTYSVDIPVPDSQSAEGFSLDLEGIDVDALLEKLMSAATIDTDEDGTVNFSIPYTAVNEALGALMPLLSQLPDTEAVDLDGLAQSMQDLQSSNSGVNLDGWLSSTDTETTVGLELTPVEAGQAAEGAAFGAYFYMENGEEDKLTLSLELDSFEGEEETELLYVYFGMLDTAYFSVSLMNEIEFAVSFDPESSVAGISFDSEDTSLALDCVVGMEEGAEVAVCQVGDAATAVDINDISDAQSEELANAFTPVMEYLMPVLEAVG
ncbi:MAG: hypothetical protein K6C12_08925 [Oscillospiraceae bacterium]|nr:hypothetical protein [Oscillospiraceae bacterium]